MAVQAQPHTPIEIAARPAGRGIVHVKEHHSDPRHAPQATGELQPDYGNIPRLKSWSAVDGRSSSAFSCDAFKTQVIEHGVDRRQNIVEGAGLRQLFVPDPNGVIVVTVRSEGGRR